MMGKSNSTNIFFKTFIIMMIIIIIIIIIINQKIGEMGEMVIILGIVKQSTRKM